MYSSGSGIAKNFTARIKFRISILSPWLSRRSFQTRLTRILLHTSYKRCKSSRSRWTSAASMTSSSGNLSGIPWYDQSPPLALIFFRINHLFFFISFPMTSLFCIQMTSIVVSTIPSDTTASFFIEKNLNKSIIHSFCL